MGLNINTIVPAVEKAKNIATEQYVDTSVASVDVSSTVNSSISSNNDVFAQKLGYANYAAMVSAASAGNSIIVGGFLKASLIQAGAITSNHINADTALVNKLNVTGGLVANNIRIAGVNGGGDLMWNNNGKIVINNLQVLGSASLPGISRNYYWSIGWRGVTTRSNGSNPAYDTMIQVWVPKPYACNSFSIMFVANISNQTSTGNSKDCSCLVDIDGAGFENASSASWNISTTTSGGISGRTADNVLVSVYFGGRNTVGIAHASLSCLAIVES